MSLRILFAIHGPADPATAVFMTASARADYLRRAGHTVDVATPADFGTGRWPRVQPLLLPLELAARLRSYDVVIFHSHLAWAHHLGIRRRRGRRPATIVALHGLEPLYHEAVVAELARTGERLSRRFEMLHLRMLPPLLRMACRRADGVFCLNSRERAFLVERRWASPTRITLVANGVSRDVLAIEREYRAAGTRLLFVGQWLRPKGIRYLVESFSAISRASGNAELTCVGTLAEAERVRGDFPADLRRRVRVRPRVSRAELAEELARADLFVSPSLSEGSSAALLEALATGLPIVTTPAGLVPDLLTDGIHASIVPFANASAIVRSVGRLMPDVALRQALGTSGRSIAGQFEWDRVNATFAAEVQRIAGRA
jgi:glycosyltransferase involved in cell wall biosynthesis